MFDLLIDSELSSPIYNADRRGTGNPNLQIDQGILQLQDVFNPLVLFLATLGILLAAVRMLWTRRLDPMLDMIRGLLTVIVVTFGGLFLIYALRNFSGALTWMVLKTGTYGDQDTFLESAKEVYPSIVRVGASGIDLGFGTNEVAEGALGSLVGLALILGLNAQLIVLAMLDSIVYLIACLLPLAAASAMIPGLKLLSKVIGWLFACFLYKPLLLMIYLVGLVILANANGDEDDLRRYLLGAAIMLLATGALPVLMKLMSSSSVWMLAIAAGGVNALTSGGGGGGSGSGGGAGGGTGGGTNADPASAMNNAANPSGGTGGAQAAAAGANERAAGVARNLDEGGPGTGGDGTGGPEAGGDGSVMAASASDTGSGAAATAALGTQNGQLSALGGTGGADSAATGGVNGSGDGGAGTGDAGPGAAEGAMVGADGGGAGTAASGATESVSSTVSGSEQSYSQTVASGADGADTPGGGAPPRAATPPAARRQARTRRAARPWWRTGEVPSPAEADRRPRRERDRDRSPTEQTEGWSRWFARTEGGAADAASGCSGWGSTPPCSCSAAWSC
ncbi:hypothetical protein [Nocardiopsis sp. CNR-923]|uniref:hypothetical protein n=1 Tax=Nocardiopsis sp. CNR-923 TaxID=1904965 RepID=UPI0009F816BA|nr:hypothetical protein [Nocardiopsis sp. CNR-923]